MTGSPRFGFRLKDSGVADSADNFKLAGLVAGGSGTITLRFAYTVQPGDSDDDGISIGSGSQTFRLDSGDAIRDAATNSVDAALAHGAPGTQSSHRVGGLPRAPANFRLEPATGTNLRLDLERPERFEHHQLPVPSPSCRKTTKTTGAPTGRTSTGSDATTTSVVSTQSERKPHNHFRVARGEPARRRSRLAGDGDHAAGARHRLLSPNRNLILSPNQSPSRNRNLSLSRNPNRNPFRRCRAPRHWCSRCCWPGLPAGDLHRASG